LTNPWGEAPIETAAQCGTAAARRGLILTYGRGYPTTAITPTPLDKDLLMHRRKENARRETKGQVWIRRMMLGGH
jgi:hypothetical protein